ncbi:GNAT family N-acetyltransferase [Stappia sp. F7233]|uniref:GNAT family N-acetyltransferase n=1 Tax=Stappia albiluteola TaxID=2758565 RepID=A0A839ADI8_9HYPH|nr:GNAT family N-acetyltransferase [Stappia albiluteola]MBA5776887.1 GNAT family N-acetyltransferase [Stappia albiluteola]
MLQTKRLRLRRWKEADIDPFAEICSDPDVMRWIGNGRTRSRQECVDAIERFERHWQEKGVGLFAVDLLETNALIGFSGFLEPDYLPGIMPAIEIGWRLKRDCWGKGLATEGARAALDFGMTEGGLQRVISLHQVGNEASGRVMQKIGMQFLRETVEPDTGRMVRVYEIVRDEKE